MFFDFMVPSLGLKLTLKILKTKFKTSETQAKKIGQIS